MFKKNNKKSQDQIKCNEAFAQLLSQAIEAPDLTSDLKVILGRHAANFKHSQNIERVRAQLLSDLRPYALKRTLPHAIGELYLALGQRHLTLSEITAAQGFLMGLTLHF